MQRCAPFFLFKVLYIKIFLYLCLKSKQLETMKAITSLEAKVKKYESKTGFKSNNLDWSVMEDAHMNIVETVEKRIYVGINEFNEILDKYTLGKFKNPEFSAIRAEAVETLELIGYTVNNYGVFKKSNK